MWTVLSCFKWLNQTGEGWALLSLRVVGNAEVSHQNQHLASLGDGLGDLKRSLWLYWPTRHSLEPERALGTQRDSGADKCSVFPQTGWGDGAAWPEQLGGGWWQEAV